MKKLLLITALILTSALSFGQQLLGKYYNIEKPFFVMSGNVLGTNCVKIDVGSISGDETYKLVIMTDEKVEQWRQALIEIQKKFQEWEKVAKENNVRSFFKEIDVELPTYELWWTEGEELAMTDMDIPTPKAIFGVLADGTIAIRISDEAISFANPNSRRKWAMFFFDPNEMDGLIQALSANRSKNVEELFK